MKEIQFVGEHLGPGQLGHFFVILSFVAALFSAFSYWRSAQTEIKDAYNSQSWLLMGRNGFIVHAASVFGIFLALYYIIANHLFEYHYAWEHSSRALPMKYLLSCFWEGQQGSFLLWSIWHCVLGLVVMARSKALESRTMAIISLVQACLATMLLGFHFGDQLNIGSTPFQLLRHQMQGAPIFLQPDYLSRITDGNGLNPLLQNYWMVIHPPVLFLGFASTLIPFAFLMAALWKGDYQQWIRPTISWSLFAGAVLGVGIMMGGAWAYESLNFGGYWAWDPVENASLVPWLTLVAGLHTLIIYKATGRSFITTAILLGVTYLMIWYSTFLTRTGILGDTSVHAFTGEGKSLTWHLLAVIGIVLVLFIGALVSRWKSLPRVKNEEATATREFWMFIGAVVLLLSSVQIILSTSIPVYAPLIEKLFNKKIAPPIDPIAHYNSVQVWVAIILALLSSSVLFLRFRTSDTRIFWKRALICGAIALMIAMVLGFLQHIPLKSNTVQYVILLFTASFAVVASLYYAFGVQKKFKKMGAAFSHLGFGILLLGILFSSYNKEVISLNTLGMMLDFGKGARENAKENRENVMLYRDVPVAMADYFLTYKGDSVSADDPRHFYRVDYVRRDEKTKKITERFSLYPDAFLNPRGQEGLSANPDSKHYWDRDIFTFVSSVSDPASRTAPGEYKKFTVHKGDSIFLNTGYLVFDGFDTKVDTARFRPQQGDVAVAAILKAYNLEGAIGTVKPIYYIRGQFSNYVEDSLQSLRLHARLSNIVPKDNAAELMIRQADPADEFIVMKAIVFPLINLVWLGTIVMVLGFFLSFYNRLTKKEKEGAVMK